MGGVADRRGSRPGSFGMPCRPRSSTIAQLRRRARRRRTSACGCGRAGRRRAPARSCSSAARARAGGDHVAERRARAGRRRRAVRRRRPRRTGWRAGCTRSRRSCRAPRRPRRRARPRARAASSHVTRSAARAVLSPGDCPSLHAMTVCSSVAADVHRRGERHAPPGRYSGAARAGARVRSGQRAAQLADARGAQAAARVAELERARAGASTPPRSSRRPWACGPTPTARRGRRRSSPPGAASASSCSRASTMPGASEPGSSGPV